MCTMANFGIHVAERGPRQILLTMEVDSTYWALCSAAGVQTAHEGLNLESVCKGDAVNMVQTNDTLTCVRKRGHWTEASGSGFRICRVKPDGKGPLLTITTG